MMRRFIVFVVCCAFFAPSSAYAQFGKLKDKIKDKANQTIDKKVDCALEEFFNDKKCVEERQAKAAAAASATTGTTKPSDGKAGEGAWANFDFVPGDKILFAEDFSVDRVGNFPKRLELETGTMEVVEWEGRRWLRSTGRTEFTITLPSELPAQWTMEFEVTIPWNGMWIYPGEKTDRRDYRGLPHIKVGTTTHVGNETKESEGDLETLFGRDVFAKGDAGYASRPFKVRVQADDNYMKVYLDEQRIANMPNMGRWTGNKLHFYFNDNTVSGHPNPPLITDISINAGGREMYDKLMANGRLAVQGIYFDVGSDRIRPESSGTLAEIVDMLKQHAELKLLVEGHTDNTGAADKNKTLSDARAAAVVSYLTEKGIDGARLKSAGFGDTKPAAANDSPENKQKNRRVELVKL